MFEFTLHITIKLLKLKQILDDHEGDSKLWTD